MLESHMDNFSISNFNYICDKVRIHMLAPAVKATNLCGDRICADNREYFLECKEDVLVLDNFKDITINKI